MMGGWFTHSPRPSGAPMRLTPLAYCVLAWLVSFVALAAEEDAWKEFRSKEGRFTVLLPGTPKQEMLDTESDFGKGKLHMNVVQSATSFYGANYCDFPEGVKKLPLKQVYDSSRDGAILNMDGKLISEK